MHTSLSSCIIPSRFNDEELIVDDRVDDVDCMNVNVNGMTITFDIYIKTLCMCHPHSIKLISTRKMYKQAPDIAAFMMSVHSEEEYNRFTHNNHGYYATIIDDVDIIDNEVIIYSKQLIPVLTNNNVKTPYITRGWKYWRDKKTWWTETKRDKFQYGPIVIRCKSCGTLTFQIIPCQTCNVANHLLEFSHGHFRK